MQNFDLLSLLIGASIGALIQFTFDFYIKQPKIKFELGSSGGDLNSHYIQIKITNLEGLFGVRLKETMIFGHLLFGDKPWGFQFERFTAKQCRLNLYVINEGLEEHVSAINWKSSNGFVETIDIESGESIETKVIISFINADKPYYQSYLIDNNNSQLYPSLQRFYNSNVFVLKLSHETQKEREFILQVRKKLDNRFEVIGGKMNRPIFRSSL